MKWEDYKPKPMKDIYEKQTNIECPKCGSKIYKRLDIVLTSYPPQYQYECHNCGWIGYNY